MFISAVLLAVLAPSADAALYHRFWRGYKLPALTEAAFERDISRVFIPRTVKVGGGRGLVGYQPVLTAAASERGTELAFLPDEIALVTYESEARYRAIRETPEGRAYGDLHWEYFERGRSGSQVPGPFMGQAELEKAYDLLGSNADWREGYGSFRITARRPGLSDADYLYWAGKYLEKVQQGFPKDLQLSVVVLVGREAVYEYRLWLNADVHGGLGQTLQASVEKFAREAIGRVVHDAGHVRFDGELRFGQVTSVRF
jgi:hypothetical protein